MPQLQQLIGFCPRCHGTAVLGEMQVLESQHDNAVVQCPCGFQAHWTTFAAGQNHIRPVEPILSVEPPATD